MADFSYSPATGVLSGSSFETQTVGKLQRAAVGLAPASSGTNLSTAGATSEQVTYYGFSEQKSVTLYKKTFTAPSAGWYSVKSAFVAEIINNTNGMHVSTDADGAAGCIMPVGSGQSVTLAWVNDASGGVASAELRFIPAVEA